MTKPAEDPKAAEPDQPTFVPEHPEQPEDPAPNAQPEIPELSVDETNIYPSSSVNPLETHADDILITGTRFTEPGNPTILVRHSAKQ